MGSEAPFSARVESRNGVARIALGGELDLASVPPLIAHLTQVEQDGVSAIALDLRDVRFIDSTGLHALLEARDRATTNGHRFLILGVATLARRVFELTGTEFLLDDPGATEVLARFTGAAPPEPHRTMEAEAHVDA